MSDLILLWNEVVSFIEVEYSICVSVFRSAWSSSCTKGCNTIFLIKLTIKLTWTTTLLYITDLKNQRQKKMGAWDKWFESIADIQVDKGSFHQGGSEISAMGTTELPFGKDSITGFTIIKTKNFDEAEKIAKVCPIVFSTIVYEIMRW